MKIVVDSEIPFLRGVLEPFSEVVYRPGTAISAADVRDAAALLVRTRTCCNSALLDGSAVRFIGSATIGTDHIDTDFCASHGIAVAAAAGSNARGVLQWVAAALAWSAKNGLTEHPGAVLGVVGVGNVGSLVAEYAALWGFRVMRSDPPCEKSLGLGESDGYFPVNEIVSACDIITFHVPLTDAGPDATRGFVGHDFLAATKPNALIFNSSRGAVIDPEALRQWVGRRGFVIDTWNSEPAIDRAVLQHVLLGTPHIAGYTTQGKATATAMIINALAREFPEFSSLRDWFPEGALRNAPRPIGWGEMCATMPSHFDIAAESALLKASPERFEQFRDKYQYREEFF